LANSSWTRAHIAALWGGQPKVVYPPCNVAALLELPAERAEASEPPYVLSVGQFRPEKRHDLQLRAWAMLEEEKMLPTEMKKARLKLVGGARNVADEARVTALRELASTLGVSDSVEFLVNVPHARLRELLAGAAVGVHSMLEEHFGIGVVECMAAGAVTVAHRSGGPLTDIVVPAWAPAAEAAAPETTAVGFLAATAEEYAQALSQALSLAPAERAAMVAAARARVPTFSDERFARGFADALAPLLKRR